MAKLTATDARMEGLLSALQELGAAHRYLTGRVADLRQEYARLNGGINLAISSGTPRRGKRKLSLSMPDLAQHMKDREARTECQHKLLILVPAVRLVRASLQQSDALDVKTTRQLPFVTQMLHLRCVGALPHAKDEAEHLFATFPALFGARPPAVTAVNPVKKANVEKAKALHAKLLASGLLDSDELVTLRKVFERYAP